MDFESMAYDAGYNAGYAAASPVAIIGAVVSHHEISPVPVEREQGENTV